MKYKAVLFDMDGTLLDTLSDMHAAANHILTCHGWQTRSREEIRAFVGNAVSWSAPCRRRSPATPLRRC